MQRLAELILSVRARLVGLEDLFAHWDEEIAFDPDDPRERTGRLPGLERVLPLSAALLERLEKDLREGRVARGEARDADAARVERGLRAMDLALESARLWHQTDELDRALEGMTEAAETAESCHITPRDDQPGRFYHDLGRLAEDYRVMASMLEIFQRNRRRRPALPNPEYEKDWPASRWFEMLLDQARREDRIIEIIESKGLSLETLSEGLEAEKADRRELDHEKELFLSSHELLDKRGQVFDSENPEAFLELPEIPDQNHEDEFDYEVLGDGIIQITRKERAEERENHGFTFVCPEPTESGDEEPGRKWREDPVLEFLEPAVFSAFRTLRDTRDPEAEASALQSYVVLILLKPLARIASSYVHIEGEDEENMAPVHGAYLFALHCLDRAIAALGDFGDPKEREAVESLRRVRARVTEFI